MEREDLARLALLTSVISIAPDGIVAVDTSNVIILFNEGAQNTFGYRRDEVLGQPLDLLLPERFRSTHPDHIRKFCASPDTARHMGERQGIFALHKDGHEFPAEGAICKLKMGRQRVFTFCCATSRSISGKRCMLDYSCANSNIACTTFSRASKW